MKGLRLFGVLIVVLAAETPAAATQQLTLSVASSMKEAVEAIGSQFTEQRPTVTLRYNVGASGELQRQIEAGAPVDVFISAATRQVDELERDGRFLSGSRRELARNILVAVKPAGLALDVPGPSNLLDRRVQRIALGNPDTVPAGQYAEESLRALSLWDRLKTKLVFAENVRQVLDYVSRGEVQVGVVYATDALVQARHVRLAFPFPEDTHRPIVHLAAVLEGSRQPDLARAFVDLMAGRAGQMVLRRLGFELPGDQR